MKWIQEVERLNIAELDRPIQRWDDLDTALAEAVVNVAKGRGSLLLFLWRRHATAKLSQAVPLVGICINASSLTVAQPYLSI